MRAGSLRFVRVAHPWNDSEESHQLAFIGEIMNVANHRQQNGPRQRTDSLDRGQILVSLQLLAVFGHRLLQFRHALFQFPDLPR